MKVVFLGTGTSSGVPMIACDCEVCRSKDPKDKRLRSSVFVQAGDLHINIDVGPDFRQQMLREGINRMDAILMTHGHKDHTGGLDDVRAFNFAQGQDMDLYLDFITEKMVRNQYDYIFDKDPYPGVPRINLNSISADQPFQLGGIKITPILVHHHKLPVLAFRIEDFTYITDANRIDPEELEKVRGTKVLVVNGLRRQKHLSHFTLDEAIKLIQEIQPEQAYITHISHQLGKHQDIEPGLPENIHLAYDGLSLSF